MQQQTEERAFIPVAVENGRARTWQKIRLCFSSFTNLTTAERARLFVYAEEGTGFKKSYARAHNMARFKSRARLLPEREQAQQRAHSTHADARKQAITALKYGRRYNTTTQNTTQRAEAAGIRIRLCSRILPYAEYRRRVMAEMQTATHTTEQRQYTRTEARSL